MPYTGLKPEMIVETAKRLEARVSERFPDRGIRRVAGLVVELAVTALEQRRASHTLIVVRISVYVLIGLLALAGVMLLGNIELHAGKLSWAETLQGLDAAVNELLLLGAGIYFLLTLDRRIMRRRALAAIQRLRSVSHIIDMHQLTKDPQPLRRSGYTPSSPTRDLDAHALERYLDYCSEMLSVLGKTAALYSENTSDEVVLSAVDAVEDLTTGLSAKIWQKLQILVRSVDDNKTASSPIVSDRH